MAEEKAFEPTAARLARARREGDVPASQAFNAIASLGGAALGLCATLSSLSGAARAAIREAARTQGASPRPCLILAACAFVVPAGAFAGALISAYLQNGRIAVRMPAPKFEKLNALTGLGRMFSRDAVLAGAKALVVSSAVAGAGVPALTSAYAATNGAGSAAGLAALAMQCVATLLVSSLGVASLFAIADVLLERAKWKRRLRMSFAELKREHRQSEGDPLLRGQRRRAHRALVRGSIGRVREAAFVVCNPAHVAIALAYRPPEIPVPRVLVRAIDEGARELKRRAGALGVPIVEDVALARALLGACEVDDYIPASAYAAVAAIVAGLLRERARA